MGGVSLADPTAEVAPVGLTPFLERLRTRGVGKTVVLHTGRRTYTGRLLRVDPASIRLEAQSDEFDQTCRLEVDPLRLEAFEILDG